MPAASSFIGRSGPWSAILGDTRYGTRNGDRMAVTVASRPTRFTLVKSAVVCASSSKANSRCNTSMATGGCRSFSYAVRRSITLFESPALPLLATTRENPASVCTVVKKCAHWNQPDRPSGWLHLSNEPWAYTPGRIPATRREPGGPKIHIECLDTILYVWY